MPLNRVSLNSSSLFKISSQSETNFLWLKTYKEDNAECLSTPRTNMHSQSTSIKLRIPSIASSLKELRKKFGNSVIMLTSEECLMKRTKNGTNFSRPRMILSVKMEKEYWALQKITFQKISSLADTSLISTHKHYFRIFASWECCHWLTHLEIQCPMQCLSADLLV
jgi:hypothetical protein